MIAQASRVLTEQSRLREQLLRNPTLIGPPQMEGAQDHDRTAALTILRWAEPFYVSSECAELIRMAADTIPAWPLRAHDLSVPSAFVWFNSPVPLASGGMGVLRAVLWSRGAEPHDEFVAVLFLFDTDSGPTFSFRYFWKLGTTVEANVELVLSQHEFDPAGRDTRVGRDTVADHRTLFLRLFRILASFFAFVRQHVLVAHRERADRGSRRFAQRAGVVADEPRVVLLRPSKAGSSSANGQDDSVDWSCRWWVAGHWRQQPCGEARMERRPTWIAPHLKGPEDKPVRITKRLFAVVR